MAIGEDREFKNYAEYEKENQKFKAKANKYCDWKDKKSSTCLHPNRKSLCCGSYYCINPIMDEIED